MFQGSGIYTSGNVCLSVMAARAACYVDCKVQCPGKHDISSVTCGDVGYTGNGKEASLVFFGCSCGGENLL